MSRVGFFLSLVPVDCKIEEKAIDVCFTKKPTNMALCLQWSEAGARRGAALTTMVGRSFRGRFQTPWFVRTDRRTSRRHTSPSRTPCLPHSAPTHPHFEAGSDTLRGICTTKTFVLTGGILTQLSYCYQWLNL